MNPRAFSQYSLCHVAQNLPTVHLSPSLLPAVHLPLSLLLAIKPSTLPLSLSPPSLPLTLSGHRLRPCHRRLTLSPPTVLRCLPLSPFTALCPHLFPASSPSPWRGRLRSSVPPSLALLLSRLAQPFSLLSTAPQAGAPPLHRSVPSLSSSFPAHQPLCPAYSPPPAPSTSGDPSMLCLSPSPLGPPLRRCLGPLRPLTLLSSPTPVPLPPSSSLAAPLRGCSTRLSPLCRNSSPMLSHPSRRPSSPRSLHLGFSPSHRRSPYPHPATPPPSPVTTKPSCVLLAPLQHLALPESLLWLTVAA